VAVLSVTNDRGRDSFLADNRYIRKSRMKGFLLFLAGAIVGLVIFAVVGTGVLTGLGAGVGIVTGLKAGACVTVEAAKEQGLISAEQVDQVLNAAIAKVAGEAGNTDGELVVSDAECQRVVDEWLTLAASDQ